ncbi:hypothetical protein PVAP13_1NG171600, partial [Panicum virgatum]
EGQDSKTATEAVVEVLPSSKFLQNIELETTAPKKSATPAVRARVQELEAEVQAEKLESLKSKVEESEAVKQKQQEELDSLKKQGEETNSLLRRLLCLSKE